MTRRMFKEYLNPNFGYFYSIDESLFKTRTRFQELEIVQTREFGKVMLLDGVTQVATKNDWLYHEVMVHPALSSHPDPQSVCVIGAGDGGIVREVLLHGPSHVDHCELDGEVVDVCREHLPEVHGNCWDNPAVNLVIGDGRAAIEEGGDPYDVVIMDMTDPFGPSTMLYTADFFKAIKSRFRDGNGSFVMHAESTISRPRAFQQIHRTLSSVFKQVTLFHIYIQMYSVLWTIAVASDHDRPATISEEEIAAVLARRGIADLHAYTPATHYSMQAEFPFITKLREAADSVPVVTDAEPKFLDEIDLNINHIDA